MTKGLERAGKTKLKLYRKCLAVTSTRADRKEYSEYRNIFNNLKRNLKAQYYQQKCNQFKDNVKKLWALINETIRKVTQREYYTLHNDRWEVELHTKRHSEWLRKVLLIPRVNTSSTNCSWHDICKRLY